MGLQNRNGRYSDRGARIRRHSGQSISTTPAAIRVSTPCPPGVIVSSTGSAAMSKSRWLTLRLSEKRLRLRPCLPAVIGLNDSRLAAQGAQAEVKERRDQEADGDK